MGVEPPVNYNWGLPRALFVAATCAQEKILRVHCDKLTPNFKANSPTRKLTARVGSYLSGLLHFLGVLEVGYSGRTLLSARAR